MSATAIRVQGLSKRFRLGARQERYATLRDTLARALPGAAWRRYAGVQDGDAANTVWALRDVSFDVPRGQVAGIIGPNGAGKSTLLKLLSRVSHPTAGRAEIHGSVGSLLEVGTGFHPELTGAENIYLNGAILGMPRAEIRRKFDEIVAFAEVERFIETPVKHYSTGMYLRLAFAVAAHLEPEILLVDEVLAVGDAAFQRKCLGKIGDIARQGRTVLFVSHNMVAVESLCQRVIWLRDGEIAVDGEPARVISSYLHAALEASSERVWPDRATAPGTAQVRLHRLRVRPAEGAPSQPVTVHTPLSLEAEYWNDDPQARLWMSVCLYNEQDVLLFDVCPPQEAVGRNSPAPTGLVRTTCRIPADFLNDGLHRAAVYVWHNDECVVAQPEALVFTVLDSDAQRGGWYGKWQGAIRPSLEWSVEAVPEGAR